ncbi:MAG: hypothetical protein N3B13_03170, partial [Deltaproteobacteria bacterium]|nr:hypothetical protein [Deltaproteobacteria bacterium]
MIRKVINRLLAVVVLGYVLFNCNGEVVDKKGKEGTSEVKRGGEDKKGWLATVQSRIAVGEYRISPQGDRFHAANRQQNLRFFFYEGGRFTLQPREEEAESVELKTITVRQGGSFVSLNEGAFSEGRCVDESRIGGDGNCLARLERKVGNITEWFDNREDGLEQGFDLSSP